MNYPNNDDLDDSSFNLAHEESKGGAAGQDQLGAD